MGYTWAQFTHYLRLAKGRDADRLATQLVVTNHAYAGGDGARKLLDQLRRVADDANREGR